MGEPLSELMLRGSRRARPDPDDDRRGPRRLPAAPVRHGYSVSGKLDPNRTALVVIDVQEAFRKAVPGFDGVTRAATALIRGAEVIGIPIVITEQYPKGL